MAPSYRMSDPPIYTFRVRILDCLAGFAPEDCREIQREIEIAANHTLADLADAICRAYGFDDPHMWSFFLSGKRWDTMSEYTIDTDGASNSFDTPALADLIDRIMPPDAPIDEQFAELQAFIHAFIPSFSRETRDRMRVYLDLPPSDAPSESNNDIDDDLIWSFMEGFDPEFLVAVEMILVSAPPEQVPELHTGLAAAMRQDILSTLDMSDGTDDADASASVLDSSILSLASLFPAIPPDLFPEERLPAMDAERAVIRDVPYPGKTGKQEFLFLFDYGDEWEFGVKLMKIAPTKTPRARYPRVTARRGKSPRQYPPLSWYKADDTSQIGIALAMDPYTGAMVPRFIEIPATAPMFIPKAPRKKAKTLPETDDAP